MLLCLLATVCGLAWCAGRLVCAKTLPQRCAQRGRTQVFWLPATASARTQPNHRNDGFVVPKRPHYPEIEQVLDWIARFKSIHIDCRFTRWPWKVLLASLLKNRNNTAENMQVTFSSSISLREFSREQNKVNSTLQNCCLFRLTVMKLLGEGMLAEKVQDDVHCVSSIIISDQVVRVLPVWFGRLRLGTLFD